ncbi:hypothetical protein JG688_00011128 [Phytophthora aleatoria]|uniref:Uncharacterized protein n=1 Tax=Phytophthora aleatoria TaxID=2496075 RepID=A0A8J5IDJ5_9STRA|nr:hypothetical protein JG688_00011128 [Phytophthora aleatoria]
METPPLLTTVLALPSTMHGIPHLLELVNHYILPLTIDNAVVNDLQLVMKIYGDLNSWTSGAMDGAAANGDSTSSSGYTIIGVKDALRRQRIKRWQTAT